MLNYNLPDTPEVNIRIPELGGRMKPGAVLECLQDIKEGILSMADTIDRMESAISRQRYQYDTAIGNIKQDIDALRSRIELAGQRNGIICLSPAGDIEYDRKVYSLGQAIPGEYESSIHLPVLKEIDYTELAGVEVIYQHGASIEQNDPAGLKDRKPWSAAVRTREPVKLDLPPEFLPADCGVPCVLRVTMKRPVPVNRILIEPLAELPMDLLGVFLYSADKERVVIVGRGSEAIYESMPVDGPVVLRFQDQPVSYMEIVINQRHCERMESAAAQRAWYEYRYGIKSIGLKHVIYADEGEWISRRIGLARETNGLLFTAGEIREWGQLAVPHSSAEYSLMLEGSEWIDILPFAVSDVRHELLDIAESRGVYTAKTRFPVNGRLTVYGNGVPLKPGTDYHLDGDTIVFNTLAEQPVTVSYTSVPQWEILPREHLIDVREEFPGTDEGGSITLGRAPYIDIDRIAALPDDWEPSTVGSAYRPVEVEIYTPEGRILKAPLNYGEDGVYDATRYRGGIPAVPDGMLSFVLKGNTLSFSRALTGGYRILVNYKAVPGYFRIRVVMRKHYLALAGVTPEIKTPSVIII